MYETPEIHVLGKVSDLTLGGNGGDWESEDISVLDAIPCDKPLESPADIDIMVA